jgi:hypothetical protein
MDQSRLNLIQEKGSVMSWLKRLIDRFTKRRTERVLPGPSVHREIEAARGTAPGDALRPCPRCGVVPMNWDVHEKWCRFASETKRSETILVGAETGIVRVPRDRATHPPQGRVQAIRLASVRESWKTSPEQPNVPAAAEIRCINCDATRPRLEARGPVQSCCREPFWTVPFELMWRSLPRGEDR